MATTTLTTGVLATIACGEDLDGIEHRTELFVHDGRLWARTPDGKEADTGHTSGIDSLRRARADIRALYADETWDLQWEDGE